MPDTAKNPGKSRGVVFALLLTLAALALVAAAVVWAGGIDGVTELLGFGGGSGAVIVEQSPDARDREDFADAQTREPESAETTAAAEETLVADAPGSGGKSASGGTAQGAFPVSAAQAAMYREQLQSQANLTKLANNEFSSFTMGTTTVSGATATIPLSAKLRSGAGFSGWMKLTSSEGLWYFSMIGTGPQFEPVKPRAVDSGVVRVIAEQQAASTNQDLLKRGVVDNGFVTARVDGVAKGSGTATVNVTLLGGALDRRAARFVMISKEDSGKKYWFVTRFELK